LHEWDSEPRLDDLALFLEVARRGSFAEAARSLRLPTSTLSRRVAALERDLQTQLLRRTTRRVRLTDSGRALAERADARVADLRGTLESVADRSDRPIAGTLRVAAPVMLGRDRIGPLLLAFAADHPDLRIEMQLANEAQDLLDSGVDLAIRVGPLADSDHMARRLWDVPYRLVAHPAWIERHPGQARLSGPDALQSCECVVTPPIERWRFREDETGRERSITPGTGDRVGDLLLGLRAIEAGRGVGYLPAAVIRRDAHAPLSPIEIPGWRPATRELYGVFPRTRWLAPRVRAALDYIAAAGPGDAPVASGAGDPQQGRTRAPTGEG
jgi:DNA-binding transcriptional LysR family regulator